MSATGRGGEPIALDAYYTPDDVAARCVAALPTEATWRVRALEPSVGGGAFVRALRALDPGPRTLRVIDINPDAPGLRSSPAWAVSDFLAWPPTHEARQSTRRHDGDVGDGLDLDVRPPYDLIVGNPPYSHAEAHIRHALSLVDRGGYVAFLLRLAMLESVRRRPLWAETPLRSVHVLSARPSFTGGGTDSAAYGWFVWQRGYVGAPTLGWL